VNRHTAPTVSWASLQKTPSRSSSSDQQAGPPPLCDLGDDLGCIAISHSFSRLLLHSTPRFPSNQEKTPCIDV
jgi:hypothetical protein